LSLHPLLEKRVSFSELSIFLFVFSVENEKSGFELDDSFRENARCSINRFLEGFKLAYSIIMSVVTFRSYGAILHASSPILTS